MSVRDSLSVVQLTDLHLLADPEQDFKGQKPWHNLVVVLEQSLKAHPVDLFLLTGDLSQDESVESYQQLYQLMQETGVPWHWIPGNHDSVDLMQALHPIDFSVVSGEWQWLLLNSQSGQPHGELDESQRQQLLQALEQPQALYQAIAVHHQPLLVGPGRQGENHNPLMDNSETIAGIDSIPLRDQGWLWQTLTGFPAVKTVICGHVHQEQHLVKDQLSLLTTPATSIQFASDINEFQIADLAPGYRWLNLMPDGHVESRVYRLEN